MDLDDYSRQAHQTAKYPPYPVWGVMGSIPNPPLYPLLGLSGEVGEIFEKIKKIIRDKNCIANSDDWFGILYELGDILWYLNEIALSLGVTLQDIAAMNLEKLKSRNDRNAIQGSGDDR